MTDIAAIKERHFSCCSATKTDHSITPDFPEHCVADDQPWPCDAAQLLALLADTPSVEPPCPNCDYKLTFDQSDSHRNHRCPLPEERRAAFRPSVEPAGVAGALAILDVIDGIVDDTHPEGDGCPLCAALDELRDILGGTTR